VGVDRLTTEGSPKRVGVLVSDCDMMAARWRGWRCGWEM
jgi:hypothetical protein